MWGACVPPVHCRSSAGSGWEEGLGTVDSACAPEWLASTDWSLNRDFFHGFQLMYCA